MQSSSPESPLASILSRISSARTGVSAPSPRASGSKGRRPTPGRVANPTVRPRLRLKVLPWIPDLGEVDRYPHWLVRASDKSLIDVRTVEVGAPNRVGARVGPVNERAVDRHALRCGCPADKALVD